MIDFLVIGGGIAGTSAAARLSHLGRVTVLEAETALGYHASGRSAALFDTTYGKPAVVALNLASRGYHATANGGVLTPRGMMMVSHDEALFRADRTAMNLGPMPLDEALARYPILNTARVRFAAYHEDAWDLDTDRLIQNFAREVRAKGGTVRTGARVTAIARTAAGWRVSVGPEDIETRVLVDAAGSWADEVARMAGIRPLGLTPMRRSMARIPAPAGHDVSRWPMVYAAGEAWYSKPDAGSLLVSPSEEHPSEPHDAWADDMVIAEGLARFEADVTIEVTRVLTTWAGLRTFTPDRVLALGPDARDPAFVWVAGQGGYGFQTAPAASRLVADLVGGSASELGPDTVAALSPARFG